MQKDRFKEVYHLRKLGRKGNDVSTLRREGVVTSFNEQWVFVRFGPPGGKAETCKREDLHWK